MTCRHCTQNPVKDSLSYIPDNGCLDKSVKDFLVKWSNLPNEKSSPRNLFFWGGEPLLYWDFIKRTIIDLERSGFGRVTYRIFTNGLLLNDDIVNFINSRNIVVTLSYDAPNPLAVRNNVPDKKQCEFFMEINNRIVNSVFNNLNFDLVKALLFLESKFPNTRITFGVENVLSPDTPLDCYDGFERKVKKSILDFAEYAKSTRDSNALAWFNVKRYRGEIFSFGEFLHWLFPMCAEGIGSLSIDTTGNVLRCHNDGKVLANISEDFNSIQNKFVVEWESLLPPNCLGCSWLPWCRNACPIALKTEDGREYVNCSFMKEFWKTIVFER